MIVTPAAAVVGYRIVKTLGANAITDVRFTTSYIMGAASEILTFGNAVVIEPEARLDR